MAADKLLDLVGKAGGPLADASLWHLEMVDVSALSPSFRRMVLAALGLDGLRYSAGQDLMFRVPWRDGGVINRRYTIRHHDATRSEVTVDVSLHGAGPGTDWVRAARIGDQIDAIGPRGKITPRLEADWHLFLADDTGVPGALAMSESLPATSTILAVLEVDTAEDEQESDASQREIHWLHRLGRSAPGDSGLLRQGLDDLELGQGFGHAYLAAESAVVRDLRAHLIERGMRAEDISAKAYWRRGLPNADHGEPLRQAARPATSLPATPDVSANRLEVQTLFQPPIGGMSTIFPRRWPLASSR